jgi:hypothetical protein
LDNFEWSEGYGPNFAIMVSTHYRNAPVHPKPGAYAYARVTATGRVAELPESQPGLASAI